MSNSFLLKLYNSPTLMTWANLLSKTVGLALLLPLVLSSFSENDIILWYVLTTMVGLGLLFDLGFTPTFVRFVAYANAGASIDSMNNITKFTMHGSECSNKDSLQAVVKIIDKNYLVISFLSFAILLSIGSFFVAKPIAESSSTIEGWFAWGIVCATTSLILFGNKYVAILQGLGKIAENQRVMLVSSVFATLAASLALILNADLLIVISIYQGITSLSIFLNFLLVKKSEVYSLSKGDSDCAFTHRDETGVLKGVIFSSAWKSAIGIMMSVGIIHLSGIAAANYLSPSDAAMYLLSLQLIRAISSFSQAPFYTKIPIMAGLYANKKLNKLKNIAFNAESLSLFIFAMGSFFAGILFPFVEDIFQFNASLPDPKLWLLLSFGILVERSGAMHIQIYSLTNKIIWHYVNGITGLCMIFLFFLFIEKHGVMAFPLSLFISYSLLYFPISSFCAATIIGKLYIAKQSILMIVYSLFLLLLWPLAG